MCCQSFQRRQLKKISCSVSKCAAVLSQHDRCHTCTHYNTLVRWQFHFNVTFSRVTGSVGVLLRQKTGRIMWILWIGSTHNPSNTHTDTHKSVLCLFAYWCNTGHVYEAVVLPRNPPTTLPLPLRCVSVRPQQSPSPARFTTEMAAKVSRSVLLLSRSSGAVAGSLPALVVSSQRHHQHIRPVSPRTCVCLRTGEGGREGCRTGRAGWTGEKKRQWRRLLRLRK